jgi:hypothetical protein
VAAVVVVVVDKYDVVLLVVVLVDDVLILNVIVIVMVIVTGPENVYVIMNVGNDVAVDLDYIVELDGKYEYYDVMAYETG